MDTATHTPGSDLGHALEMRTQESIGDLKSAEAIYLAASRHNFTGNDDLDEDERRKLAAEKERQARAELQAAIASTGALLDEIDDLLGTASERARGSSTSASQTTGLVSNAHDVVFQGSAAEEGFLEGLALLLDQAISAARQLLGIPTNTRERESSFTDRMSRMAQALLGLQQTKPGGLQVQPRKPVSPFSQSETLRSGLSARQQRGPDRLALPALTADNPVSKESTPKARHLPGCPLCVSQEPASHTDAGSSKGSTRQTRPTRNVTPQQSSEKPKNRQGDRGPGSPTLTSFKKTSQKKPKVPPAFALPFPVMTPVAPVPALPLPPPRPIPAVPPGVPVPGPSAPLIGLPPAFSLKG